MYIVIYISHNDDGDDDDDNNNSNSNNTTHLITIIMSTTVELYDIIKRTVLMIFCVLTVPCIL